MKKRSTFSQCCKEEVYVKDWNRILVLVAGLLHSLRAVQDGTDTAQEIVDKAIAAHGGKERIQQFDRCRTVYKGKVYRDEKAIPLEAELWEDGPSHKQIMRMTFDQTEHVLITVVTKDTAWRKFDNEFLDVPDDEVKGMKESTNYDKPRALCGLKGSPDLMLSRLKDGPNGATLGVRVSEKGKSDIDLFFDAKTFLLAKVSSVRKNGRQAGKIVEEHFENYKEFAEAKVAYKKTTFVDGKKLMETDIAQIEILKKVNPSFFAKP